MNILVTGGAGYIGSHTVLELLNKDYSVAVVDNLSNSNQESLARVEKLTGKNIDFHNFDLRETEKLDALFAANSFNAVIHFAGLKIVGDSVSDALDYYHNNLVSTLSLLKVMDKANVRNLVFSSSANIYGDTVTAPITEDSPKGPTNPYGQTKFMIEQILKDIAGSKNGWHIISLRYFNPIGAHKSGEIGEDPNGTPTNLVPYIAQVAAGKLKELSVYGGNYDTVDGTGIRDFIHVVDLANAHIVSIDHISDSAEYRAFNIGTGIGHSVLEMIRTFEKASGKKVPYKIIDRRPADIAISYADPSLANKEIGWEAKKTVEEASKDAWNWQSKNPNGYN